MQSSLQLYPWASTAGGMSPSWIFMHDTDKVEGGLIVLFFSLVFSVGPSPGIFSAYALNITLSLRI